tara:strand:- start:3366 stop:5636 length:2271 start_codon:yes stop_codon:yes gene_type:complete
MKKLKIIYLKYKYLVFSFLLLYFLSGSLFSNDLKFEIKGNNYTDDEAIISLLNDIPENIDREYSNEIIKALFDSNLFSDVSVKLVDEKYIIIVKEFPTIDNIYFKNNERLEDEELEQIALNSNLLNYNIQSIEFFIDETKKIYQSFGYNNIKIDYSKKLYKETNTIDLYFEIIEGKITKINQIIVKGNNSISAQDIKEIIQSKTKSIVNIFANNNYKPAALERDVFTVLNYYKNNGFLDIEVKTQIEYLENNKVNIYFNVDEGSIYTLSDLKVTDEKNLLDKTTFSLIDNKVNNFLLEQKIFSFEKIEQLRKEISSLIIDSGIETFEIDLLDRLENQKIDIVFQINPILPKYTKQINIVGNSRTFDYVIRRELQIIEGDAIYESQIQRIRENLISLNLFESVRVEEEIIDDNLVNLIIEVEEKQTGTFNAGVSVGTLDGFAVVTGLRERNFYGTGRSLEVLVNTSEGKNQFKLITTDRLSYENNANISYSINYKQQDFSKASSYKLDTFTSGVGVGYRLNKNLYHNIDLEYVLKDYRITNSSTVSDSIASSSGANISYLISNNLRYSTINPGFIPKKGNYINFNNSIETPTSSSNGFIRNIITLKNYYSNNNNIFSVQTRFGNIFSLNNNDILTDDKFALGGRWLRGFDNFGVGPRNSRTSYVGGNNLAVAKLDYSYEITRQTNFPIYLNLFNDYGLVWDNKTKPTQSNDSLRSSAGFGIKYYSPIGPIGFTWGFPLMDEEYDIKRMFLFSIGNID